MCRKLVEMCVLHCVSMLNRVISSDSGNRIPAWELFTGRRANYSLEMCFAFGEYVHATVGNTDNGEKARTQGCIVGVHSNNMSGSVRMLSIDTLQVVTRDQFKVLPIPEDVIAALNDIAAQEGDIDDTEQDSPVELDADLEVDQYEDVIDGLPIFMPLGGEKQQAGVHQLGFDEPEAAVGVVQTADATSSLSLSPNYLTDSGRRSR